MSVLKYSIWFAIFVPCICLSEDFISPHPPWLKYSENATCPNTTVIADLDDPEIFLKHQREHFYQIWNTVLVDRLTTTAWKLVKVLESMVISTQSHLADIAYFHATWAPYLLRSDESSSSLCMFTKMINSSIIWTETKKGRQAASVLREFSWQVPVICDTLGITALVFSGCDHDLYTQLPTIPRCWKDGSAYDIKKALRLYGKFLPKFFKSYLHNLYLSDQYTDRVMATLTVASLVPVQKDINNLHSQNALLETIRFVVNTWTHPQCCLPKRDRIMELCELNHQLVIKNVEYLLESKYENDTFVEEKPKVFGKFTEKQVTKKTLLDIKKP